MTGPTDEDVKKMRADVLKPASVRITFSTNGYEPSSKQLLTQCRQSLRDIETTLSWIFWALVLVAVLVMGVGVFASGSCQ